MMNMHPQGGLAKDGVRPNAGIDVSKQHLDVCCAGDERRVLNDARGGDELTAMREAANVDRAAADPTGGQGRGLGCGPPRLWSEC